MERTIPEEGANPDGLLQPTTKQLPWYIYNSYILFIYHIFVIIFFYILVLF